MSRREKRHEPTIFLLQFIAKSMCVVFAVLLSIYIGNLIKSTKNDVKASGSTREFLRYWGVVVRKWNPNGNLRTMNRIFRKLGYKFVNASHGDEWDILWSIEYPFAEANDSKTGLFKPLEKFKTIGSQRINHFPGIYYITSKKSLGTLTKSRYLLPTFAFPDVNGKFANYSTAHPNARYVEKNSSNRGVQVVTVDQFDRGNEGKVYQVFFDKPFLIDGHAFDFGVYVLISSVDPLRVYRYEHEVFIRFCPEPYHPFDAKDRRKYVVEDNHMSVYDMPSFHELYDEYGYTFKTIFESLAEKAGADVERLWQRIDDAIASIILQNERRILKQTAEDGFNSTVNFFELVRFDIVFDEKLNPFVMEVNMSPNLTPAKKEHEKYGLIYEQLVYNTLRLIGAASYDDFNSRFTDSLISSNFKNIATDFEACTKHNCKRCDEPTCSVCLPCVNNTSLFHMHEAYREHVRRGNFRRVFPSAQHFGSDRLFGVLAESNKIMMRWYRAKCESDASWC